MNKVNDIPCHRWHNHHRPIPYGSHTMHFEGHWHYPLHYHEGYCEFVCVHQGKFRQMVNGQEITQKPRSIVLIRDQDAHELWGEDFVMTNIMISLAWLAQMEALWGGAMMDSQLFAPSPSPTRRLNANQWQRFQKLLHKIEMPGSNEARTARFTQFIAHLLFEHFLRPHGFEATGETLPSWLDETLTWITSQRHKPLRVEDVVEHCGLTGEHVSRSFQRYLGTSPSRYLNRERLRKAAGMLRDTSLPILDVCYSVGFDNPSYFHRLFKNAYGTTPRDYRLTHALPTQASG